MISIKPIGVKFPQDQEFEPYEKMAWINPRNVCSFHVSIYTDSIDIFLLNGMTYRCGSEDKGLKKLILHDG